MRDPVRVTQVPSLRICANASLSLVLIAHSRKLLR